MTDAFRPDAGEIASRLARRINDLTAHLLPAGRKKGNYWTVGSIDDEPGSSMWVHLSGAKAGRWQDAATGEFGDALDLVAGARFRGDKKQAYVWSLAWLGLQGNVPVAQMNSGAKRARAPAAVPAGDDWLRRYALRIWAYEAQPNIADTPTGDYLRGRDIDLSRLGRQPRALRHHPGLPHKASGRVMPAMVAAISGADGTHLSTHRTWLERGIDGRWVKARVEDEKMSIGAYPGGSIRLWRGSSGKSLKDAPADDWVVIGEGIETCLSIVLACPELRVISGVSLGNFGSVWLPDQVRNVILAADNDFDVRASMGGAEIREKLRRKALAFQRVVERYLDAGRNVRVARANVGKDFNDTLRAWRRAA